MILVSVGDYAVVFQPACRSCYCRGHIQMSCGQGYMTLTSSALALSPKPEYSCVNLLVENTSTINVYSGETGTSTEVKHHADISAFYLAINQSMGELIRSSFVISC